MESQAVRRRINAIAAHFLPADELSASHVLPMNCSSSLNSVIRRNDSRLYFARQGGAVQPSFMRQGSIEDMHVETENQSNSIALPYATVRRFDNKLFFARQGSVHQAGFMRQGCNEEALPAKSDMPLKCSDPITECSYYASQERPLFSRPDSEARFSAARRIEPTFDGYGVSVIDHPKFAVASRINRPKHELYSNKEICPFTSNVVEWSPRMDVAESGRGYVITVEIPGVNIKDIKIEVDEKRLTVTGKRSTQYMKVAGYSNDSVSGYLRREIVEGPCEVIWPLPANVNKDSVSAEFQDGFLRVVIPKL